MVAECIVNCFEVVEIDHQQCPGSRRSARQCRQSLVEAGAVAQSGERIDVGLALPLHHALMPLQSECAQMDASRHHLLLEFRRSALLAVIEREGADDIAFRVANRA